VQATLVEHLRTLFAAFFTAAHESEQTVQLQVGYRYDLASGVPSGAVPPIVVPIAVVPPTQLSIPADWSPDGACRVPVTADSPFICRVAKVIEDWVATTRPVAEADLTFDLTAFSSLGSPASPLVRLSGLVLHRRDITDL